MGKYVLSVNFNGKEKETICVGSLETIDNFIYNNNIFTTEDLFDYVNKESKYKSLYGNYSFEIYSLSDSNEKVPLLLKGDIHNLKSNYKDVSTLEDKIFEKILKDNEFCVEFFKKKYISVSRRK